MKQLSKLVKEKRKALKLTQAELASRAGVGLRFVRDLEQGHKNLRSDKINQILHMFGHELGAMPMAAEQD